jgi:hypothetical protein
VEIVTGDCPANLGADRKITLNLIQFSINKAIPKETEDKVVTVYAMKARRGIEVQLHYS